VGAVQRELQHRLLLQPGSGSVQVVAVELLGMRILEVLEEEELALVVLVALQTWRGVLVGRQRGPMRAIIRGHICRISSTVIRLGRAVEEGKRPQRPLVELAESVQEVSHYRRIE
jgi:hypothetical protein